jgi:hypothetical protein
VARGAGYWFDAKTFELIPITDHAVWLSDLEAKVRFGLGLAGGEAKHAVSLGMSVSKGWGVVPREQPGARRERLITEALKAGWVRIRRQERVLVMEFWRRSEDMLVSLAIALKQMEIPASENVELHEVEKNSPSVVLAGDLYKLTAKEGEMTREEEGRVGWSIRDNPKGKAGMVRMKGGCYCFRVTGNPVHYQGGERVKKIAANPVVGQVFGTATYARLFVGLKTSRGFSRASGLKKHATADLEKVSLLVEMANYNSRGDFVAGYSIIPQRGRYVPTHARKELKSPADMTPEMIQKFREDSVQVILFPEAGEFGDDIDNYFRRINNVGLQLLLQLDQYEVYFELVVNGKFVATGRWAFKQRPRSMKDARVDFRKYAEEAGAIPKKGG